MCPFSGPVSQRKGDEVAIECFREKNSNTAFGWKRNAQNFLDYYDTNDGKQNRGRQAFETMYSQFDVTPLALARPQHRRIFLLTANESSRLPYS